MVEHWSYGFQDEGSMHMLNMKDFHEDFVYYMLGVTLGVSVLLCNMVYSWSNNKFSYKYILHDIYLEWIWLVIPGILMMLLGGTNILLELNLNNLGVDSLGTMKDELIVKVMGHQWYWSYENSLFSEDSYSCVDSDSLFRLLEVDSCLNLPVGVPVRLLGSSTDVIHSFGVPSLGLKMDCIPGRVNGVLSLMLRPGIYMGYCSELCGRSHYGMNISILCTNLSDYMSYLKCDLMGD